MQSEQTTFSVLVLKLQFKHPSSHSQRVLVLFLSLDPL